MLHRTVFSKPIVLLALFIGVAGCYSESDYIVELADVEGNFTLTSDKSSVDADGFSQVTLTAEILEQEVDSAHRQIVFSTTMGMLIGGTLASDGMEVAINGAGKATIVLEASQEVGIARVRAIVKQLPSMSTEVDIEFNEVSPDAIIRFINTTPTADADGASRTAFAVEVAAGIPAARRKVFFSTTAGTFAVSNRDTLTVRVDADNLAVAELISPNIRGTARIRATINSITREQAITFEPATPDLVIVSADQTTISPGGVTVVRAQLFRTERPGMVTQGTLVVFQALNDQGDAIGLFDTIALPLTTPEDPISTMFRLGNTDYRGPVTISISAPVAERTDTFILTVVDSTDG